MAQNKQVLTGVLYQAYKEVNIEELRGLYGRVSRY